MDQRSPGLLPPHHYAACSHPEPPCKTNALTARAALQNLSAARVALHLGRQVYRRSQRRDKRELHFAAL